MEGFPFQGTFSFSCKENVYRLQGQNGAGTKGRKIVGSENCKAIVLQEMGHLLQKTILRSQTGH